MTIIPFEEHPPRSAGLSSYDERHFVTYLRLLDAEAEGAEWPEAVAVIFGLDAELEPERAQNVYQSHLARAHWMTGAGYKHLLEAKPE